STETSAWAPYLCNNWRIASAAATSCGLVPLMITAPSSVSGSTVTGPRGETMLPGCPAGGGGCCSSSNLIRWTGAGDAFFSFFLGGPVGRAEPGPSCLVAELTGPVLLSGPG